MRRQREKLRKIFVKIFPGDNDAEEKRLKKVVKTSGKESKIEELTVSIPEDVRLAVKHYTAESAQRAQVVDLEQLIK
jgi:hypothetical protein